jgi:hypothetical protein
VPATVSGAPLIVKPVESTRNLSVEPAASTTVLHKPAVPTIEPMMVLQPPVTTAQPELHPKNKLFDAVVFLPA